MFPWVEANAEHGGTERHVRTADGGRQTGPDTTDARQVAATTLGFLVAGQPEEAKAALAEYLLRTGHGR